MKKTIFILGAPRSGTTLLINMLVINQSHIYGSANESQFYTTTLRQPYSLETYSNATYFKSLLNEEELKKIYQQSKDHLSFFRNTISYCLEREGKFIFAEKSPMHTLFYKELYRDFENVEFILIKRNLCANVQSIAFTKWIPLNIDGLPSFISNNKDEIFCCTKEIMLDRK